MSTTSRRRFVVDNSALATSIGGRIREARTRAGMTQQQLAAGRYTKAYISALEKGHAKPSMAALAFISERLGLPAAFFLGGTDGRWSRLEADLLLASGRWQQAIDAYEQLLESAADAVSRAEILRGQAEALCRLGRGAAAIGVASEAAELFRALGRDRDAASTSYWLANALYLAENSAEARSILRMLLDQVRSGLDVEPDFPMRLLTAAAYVETWDGNAVGAVTFLEEARVFSRQVDDRRRASFLSALAVAYFESGDLEGAIRTGSQSLALYRAADARHEATMLENNLANAYLAAGSLSHAAELAASARRDHERGGGDPREMATLLDTEARIRLASGDVDGALDLAAQAADTATSFQNRKALADAQITLARAQIEAGRQHEAVANYERAAALLREHGGHARLQEVLSEWAELVASSGDHATAYRLTREALRRDTSRGPASLPGHTAEGSLVAQPRR